MKKFRVLLLLLIACIAAGILLWPEESMPEGLVRAAPRGQIPAVFNPRFVSAAEADITDDAWILGVAVGDEAHAYSLNLMNRHEVVNDRVGGRAVAAVW